nr:MAG TPA: hypothetical protein [Caudoviricetes sp.]
MCFFLKKYDFPTSKILNVLFHSHDCTGNRNSQHMLISDIGCFLQAPV